MAKDVVKKDGSVERFDKNKVKRVMVAAGLSDPQADAIAENITSWVKNLQEVRINSFKIRERLISEMKKVNQNAANLYIWYEGIKDGEENR